MDTGRARSQSGQTLPALGREAVHQDDATYEPDSKDYFVAQGVTDVALKRTIDRFISSLDTYEKRDYLVPVLKDIVQANPGAPPQKIKDLIDQS